MAQIPMGSEQEPDYLEHCKRSEGHRDTHWIQLASDFEDTSKARDFMVHHDAEARHIRTFIVEITWPSHVCPPTHFE